MIKTNLSITSHLANFIDKNRESNSFLKKEIVTRAVGVALPFFVLTDVVIHSAGMLESGIKGVVVKQTNFSDFHKHAKCTKIFLRLFIPSMLHGIFLQEIPFNLLENETVACVNVLLLSKFPEYTKNCNVCSVAIVKYIKKHIKKMNPVDLAGMEDLPKLLDDAEKYLNRERLHLLKSLTHSKATQQLSKLIRKHRSLQDSFIKTVVFKHCLARLLSLGLTITCAVDILNDTLSTAFLLLTHVISKLLFGNSSLIREKKNLFRLLVSLQRDNLIHIAGVIASSIIGLIDPEIAINLSDTHSPWYRKLYFKGERYTESLLKDLAEMTEGQSLLIPLNFSTEECFHRVYCVADRTLTGYNFSTLNTGYGSDYAEFALKAVTCFRNGLSVQETETSLNCLEENEANKEKLLANYTFKDLTFDQLSSHVNAIRKLAESSFRQIEKSAKKQKCTNYEYTFQQLYPPLIKKDNSCSLPVHGTLDSRGKPDLTLNPQLMLSSSQKIGDCPKASLLAAINYHYSHRSPTPNYQPYDNWIRKLQEQIYDQDGYLIDISLNLKNRDRKAKYVAKDHLSNRWSSYTAKYTAT